MSVPASKRTRTESLTSWSQSVRPARRPNVRFDEASERAESPDEDVDTFTESSVSTSKVPQRWRRAR